MAALRLFDRGTRTATVLVQRPAWCLSEMRWPRPDADLRRGTRGRASGAVAGRRRDPFVGQAQSVLLTFRHLARRTLRFRSGQAGQQAGRKRAERAVARQRRTAQRRERTSDVIGRGVTVRVELGGRRVSNKKSRSKKAKPH